MSLRASRSVGRLASALVVAAALHGAARPARAQDAARPPPKAAWEAEVDAAVADQSAEIEDARRRKTMDAVVQKYGNKVSREPTPLSHFLYGRALYYNENPIGARTQMKLVLDERPDFYYARIRLAMLLADIKNFAEADKEASLVLASRPSDPDAREIVLRCALGMKDWARATRLLRERLDRDPADERARQTLVLARLQQKDVDGALADVRLLRAKEPGNDSYRYLEAVCLLEKGDLDAAAKTLEALSRVHPDQPEILEKLAIAYEKKKDLERLRTTLERLSPLLTPEQQKLVAVDIERLKQGVSPREAGEAPRERKPDIADVFAAATKSPDPKIRERALRLVYEGTVTGEVKSVPGELIIRVSPAIESDPGCRSWVVLIHGAVRPPLIPLLAIALADPEPSVRMLAADKVGELGAPIGLCYLVAQLDREFTDPADYQSLRAALSDVTGFHDLPEGVTAVTQLSQVGPSREAWRRWWLSDASTAAKLKALEGMAAAGKEEGARERHLIRFVMDPDYEVFRAAYRVTRDAVASGGDTPPQKKVFPRFPRLLDEEVTRAAMRSIQERVASWWEEFLAERRNYIEATGAVRTPPPGGAPPAGGAPSAGGTTKDTPRR